MALWMTVEQELFGLAALLLVFSCVFLRGDARDRGKGKSEGLALFDAVRLSVEVRRTFCLVIAGLMIGAFRMEVEEWTLTKEMAVVEEWSERSDWICGGILEMQKTDSGVRVRIGGCSGDAGETVRSMYCYLDETSASLLGGENLSASTPGMDLKLRMKIRVKGDCQLPDPDRNPGEFDYRQYCFSKGICGIIYGDEVQIVDSEYNRFLEFLRVVGCRLEERMDLIADKKDAGILKAVLLGNRTDLDENVYALYQKNGISHVLAISGLHVSVIGMGLWKGLRKLGMGYRAAGVTAFGVLICYGMIAGFTPSVVRAVSMMAISFLSQIVGRTYDLPSAMCVPAIGLLLWRPYSLTLASFQLSFLAVTAIFFPGEYLAKCWKLKATAGSVWTSIAIQLVTMPVILWHSFEIPVYGVVLNLVVVPLMTYVLVSGILGLAGSFVGIEVGAAMLGGCHYILMLYEWLCGAVGNLHGANLVLGRPGWGQIILYYAILAVGTWLAVEKSRKWVFLWIVGFLVLWPVMPSGLTVTFLDVGQGDGIFLQAGAKTMLVDCGSSQKKSLGEDTLVPFLKSRGVTAVDTVVVTHGDQDHVSGIRYLLEVEESGIEIGRLVLADIENGMDEQAVELSGMAAKRGIPVEHVCAGDSLTDAMGSDVDVLCLHPTKGMDEDDKNENSVVLLISYGRFKLLLTGDAGEDGERMMIEQGNLEPVTILKAGHHGSSTSTSEAFLQSVSPSYVVLSYGRGNRYGHPSEDVVERCLNAGAEIYATGEDGAIEVWTDGHYLDIR